MKLKYDITFHDLGFKQAFASEFFVIQMNTIKIRSGFEWDGASYVDDGRIINGKPVTWRATCLHDCLYRFKNPLSRKKADDLFYRELQLCGFKKAWIYYIGVRVFGFFSYKGKM